MKSPRINWKSLTINAMKNVDFSHVENEALKEQLAKAKFNRLYRQARQSIGAHQKEVNVTKELYGSLYYPSVHTFEVGDSGNKVELNKVLNPKKLRYSITEDRMQGFLKEYGDQKLVQETFKLLQTGQISQSEFNSRIKIFKKWNTKYLQANSPS